MGATDSSKTSEMVDQELAEAVLSYLAEHPDAMDTVEGVAAWWLMRQRVRVVVERVERVLSRYTEEGVLETFGSGPSRRYRLRQSVSESSH